MTLGFCSFRYNLEMSPASQWITKSSEKGIFQSLKKLKKKRSMRFLLSSQCFKIVKGDWNGHYAQISTVTTPHTKKREFVILCKQMSNIKICNFFFYFFKVSNFCSLKTNRNIWHVWHLSSTVQLHDWSVDATCLQPTHLSWCLALY